MDDLGDSVGGPPQFNGLFYFYWRSRMCSYLGFSSSDIFSLIKNGWMYLTYTTKIGVVELKLVAARNKEKLFSQQSKLSRVTSFYHPVIAEDLL